MRNRSKTIASLRRLAERPGTPQEGETAKRLLERMGANTHQPRRHGPEFAEKVAGVNRPTNRDIADLMHAVQQFSEIGFDEFLQSAMEEMIEEIMRAKGR